MMTNRTILFILFIIFCIKITAQQQDQDTLIISRDFVQINFDNQMKLSDLNNIAQKLEEKEMSIRYYEKEFDGYGNLIKIGANIKYKYLGYDVIEKITLKDSLKVGFIKDLLLDTDSLNAEEKSVPFQKIGQVPIHPDCENLKTNKELKYCLSRSVQKHVTRKFNIDLAQYLGLSPGKKRIFVMFKIDKNGDIKDVISRGPHMELENEAIRVVYSLPKMKPGKTGNEAVAVKYSLPISFIVQGKERKKKNRKKEKKENNPNQSFSLYQLDKLPEITPCKNTSKKNEKINCFKEAVKNKIEENFNHLHFQSIELSKGKKRAFVEFTINATGEIVNIEPYTDYMALKEELIRATKLLPNISPGIKNGKNVSVKCEIPISFTLK